MNNNFKISWTHTEYSRAMLYVNTFVYSDTMIFLTWTQLQSRLMRKGADHLWKSDKMRFKIPFSEALVLANILQNEGSFAGLCIEIEKQHSQMKLYIDQYVRTKNAVLFT